MPVVPGVLLDHVREDPPQGHLGAPAPGGVRGVQGARVLAQQAGDDGAGALHRRGPQLMEALGSVCASGAAVGGSGRPCSS